MFKKLALLIGFLCPLAIAANPVIFQDGKMIETIVDSKMTELEMFYSVTSQTAVGYRYYKAENQSDPVHFAQVNQLLKRWNEPDSQANIYLLGGLGSQNSSLVGYFGLETDWETRQYYLSAWADQLSGKSASTTLGFRAGFAPYVGEYDDLHTWLMLQVTHETSSMDTSTTVIPLVRVFKDNMLTELGSNGSSHLASLRFHF